jgi:NAD(P)-dependent dehydrogenase (short-subunit alcohol dehydrogenase family)
VVAVTGGGGGIGAAIAEELGLGGAFVVTMDPLVTLDGSEVLPAPEETTADRIVAAGGSARASSVSVTDAEGVRDLFEELGRLDAVVNVAGITRPTSFAKGTEEDWRGVLEVHLGGYLNILAAALPIMADAGHGRILGVTSGSGWRPADTGAYGCAKRAVASLTWQLGRQAPSGVVVNALSPIAVTRMVTAALRSRRDGEGPQAGAPSDAALRSSRARLSARPPSRAQGKGRGRSGGAATGGLSLSSMPAPADLGPFGAYLVGDDVSWCNGRVLFAGGSEVAVIDEPRLLEVVRADHVTSLAHVLEVVTAGALAPVEVQQASTGGSNPRFASVFDDAVVGDLPPSVVRTCGIVSDHSEVAAAVTAALEARGVACSTIPFKDDSGFRGAADALASAVAGAGPLDAVVVALRGALPAATSLSEWERVLDEHGSIVDHIHADAGWARAVADYAIGADRPVRLVTLTDATTAGGRSRAQAAAQLARAGRGATGERVAAFAVSVEASPAGQDQPIGELVAHLVCSPEAASLSGAELVAGPGWFGLRSHPRPSGSITFGGPGVPDWFEDTLRSIVGVRSEETR